MPINIQYEAGRGMTQIGLHRLDVVAVFNGHHCVTVTKGMEAFLLQSNGPHDLLKTFVYREMREVPGGFIGKHQVPGISPILPRQPPYLRLLAFLLFQQGHHRGSHCDYAAAAALGRGQHILSAYLLRLLELLADIQRIVCKVHTTPATGWGQFNIL